MLCEILPANREPRTAVRASLGDEAEEAWAAGSELDLDAVVDLAARVLD